MHNQSMRRRNRYIAGRLTLALLAGGALLAAACLPREHDDVALNDLVAGEPKLKEVRGAQVYFLLQPDGSVVALWGMSPLPPAEGRSVRCFIQDRYDRSFRGETRPFVDPCRSAWWGRDGQFLGFSSDPEGVPSNGPPLIRIPVEVRDGRASVDQARLDCLQSQTCQ